MVADHVHHDLADAWLADSEGPFATCPITEGSLVRLLTRQGQSGASAHAVLTALAEHPRYEFWPDSLSYRDVLLDGVVGHRQVTDSYLARLARAHNGKLITFDEGLAALHRDVAELIRTA